MALSDLVWKALSRASWRRYVGPGVEGAQSGILASGILESGILHWYVGPGVEGARSGILASGILESGILASVCGTWC